MTNVGEAGQLPLTEGGRGLLQLHPRALRRPPMKLFPDDLPSHPDVGVERFVDVTVMAGYPVMTDPCEAPFLIQLRIIDLDVSPAQHVMQLRHLQTMPLEVGNDRRFLRAKMRSRRNQALAVGPGPRGDLDHQPDPGPNQFGLLLGRLLSGPAAGPPRLPDDLQCLLTVHVPSRTRDPIAEESGVQPRLERYPRAAVRAQERPLPGHGAAYRVVEERPPHRGDLSGRFDGSE